jgi:hypothetical protein
MAVFFGFLFLASLAIWLGSVAFFGFIAGPEVTAGVPTDQSLRIVSKMARPYLRLTLVCATISFASSFFLAPLQGGFVTTRAALMGVMFALGLYMTFGGGMKIRSAVQELDAAEEGQVPKQAIAHFAAFQEASQQVGGALLLLGLVVIFITAFYF